MHNCGDLDGTYIEQEVRYLKEKLRRQHRWQEIKIFGWSLFFEGPSIQMSYQLMGETTIQYINHAI
jgi:hypothetical protein